MLDGGDAYVKSLQQELERRNQDNEALRQELKGDPLDATPASVVKSSLLDQVPEYIKNIDALARASDSDSVRLQASKLLIEWAITDKLVTGADATDDEFKKLLKHIAKKDGA